MRVHLIFPTLLLPLFAAGQFTIDFEETNGSDTTLTAGGIEWTMTGDFNCDSYDEFFCGECTGLKPYMDSGWEDGASEGYMGSLKPTDPTVVFQLGTDQHIALAMQERIAYDQLPEIVRCHHLSWRAVNQLVHWVISSDLSLAAIDPMQV